MLCNSKCRFRPFLRLWHELKLIETQAKRLSPCFARKYDFGISYAFIIKKSMGRTMNIIIYNYDDYPMEELSKLSTQTNSSIYFAFSLTEVKELLKSSAMNAVIMKLQNPTELDNAKKIIAEYPNIEYFLSQNGKTELREQLKENYPHLSVQSIRYSIADFMQNRNKESIQEEV